MGLNDGRLQASSGPSVLTGDALVTDVVDGKFFYSDNPNEKLEGTLVQLDTSDATATAATVRYGYVGYARGEKITGSYVPTAKAVSSILSNGDFTSTTGWSSQVAVLSAASNILSITGDGGGTWGRAYAQATSNPISQVLFARAMCSVNNSSCTSINLRLRENALIGTIFLTITQNTPSNGVWYDMYNSVTSPASYSNSLNILLDHFYADAETANEKVMQVKWAEIHNLTTIYGAGNEPSAADYYALLEQKNNRWIGTTYDGIVTNY